MVGIKELLNKYKYPVIILAVGLLMMLMPGKAENTAEQNDEAVMLCSVLSACEGVGEVKVIISEEGVVVVCEGANDAKVRLDIIRAVSSYTGFGTDRITVLKMTYY